ncbi:reverse transcriptase domain-containing protein [Dyadobacter jiangsuensis]
MKDWLRLRPYIHISPRLGCKSKKRTKHYVTTYVNDSENLATHRFSPLLHYKIVDHRYKRDGSKKLESGKIGRAYKVKIRPIYYANHLDTQIFAFYADKINKRLQEIYESDINLSNSVIGYRAIQSNARRNKCTIDFAREVFEFISNHKEHHISVVCLDIASFFDNLNHSVLKSAWGRLFEQVLLSKEDYQVFKATTRPYYIDLEELIPLLPDFDKRSLNLVNKSKRASLFDSFQQFRSIVYSNKLLRKYGGPNNGEKGIPQGTPISAVLSNLYFLQSDIEILKITSPLEGLYRRYSDDILLICPTDQVENVIKTVKDIIERQLSLKIQDNKTIIASLTRSSPTDSWTINATNSKGQTVGQSVGYLGFEFDGNRIRIRNSSISKYYRGLKRAIRRRAFYAKVQLEKNKLSNVKKDDWIFRAGIFRKKTHLGAKRKKIDGRVFWGNYISYVKNAGHVMGDTHIKSINRQVRNHWKIVANEIERHEKRYGLPKAPKSKNS